MKTISIANDLPSVYQVVDVPVKAGDLKNMYTYFNKKYYGGKLPKNVDFSIKKDKGDSSALGAVTLFMERGSLKKQVVTMSPAVKTVKDVNNVLLHLMIHIKNQLLYSLNGDVTMLDENSRFTRKEKIVINSKGFDVNLDNKVKTYLESGGGSVSVDAPPRNSVNRPKSTRTPPKNSMEKPVWFILFTAMNNMVYGLYSVKPFKDIDEIVDQVIANVGEGDAKSYSVYKTTNSIVLNLPKLTASGKVPKKRFKEYEKKLFADIIAERPLVKDVPIGKTGKDMTKKSGGVPEEILKTINMSVRNFRGETFDEFLGVIFRNSPGYKKYAGKFGKGSYNYGDPVPTELSEIVIYVNGVWKDVSDVEIRATHWFKDLMDSSLRGLADPKYGPSWMEKVLNDSYKKYLSDRYTEKDFYKMFIKTFTAKYTKLLTGPGGSAFIPKYLGNEYEGKTITKKVVTDFIKKKLNGTSINASYIKVIKTVLHY